MCYIEFNWTANAWQFRIADTFTDFQGVRSLPTLADWRAYLATRGCVATRISHAVHRVECRLSAAPLD